MLKELVLNHRSAKAIARVENSPERVFLATISNDLTEVRVSVLNKGSEYTSLRCNIIDFNVEKSIACNLIDAIRTSVGNLPLTIKLRDNLSGLNIIKIY